MKKQLPQELENGRVQRGLLASDYCFKWNGAFTIRGPRGLDLVLIISDEGGWEHVSVEELPPNEMTKQTVPTWETMCFVKDLVWEDWETVMQIHPPKKDYVNLHPYVLHLWRPRNGNIPRPPISFV